MIERGWCIPVLERGPPILCAFHPQNKSSSHQSPTFGPTLYKFIVMGSVQKPRPYNLLYIFPSKKYANINLVDHLLDSVSLFHAYI